MRHYFDDTPWPNRIAWVLAALLIFGFLASMQPKPTHQDSEVTYYSYTVVEYFYVEVTFHG